jgi:hypothetical protein
MNRHYLTLRSWLKEAVRECRRAPSHVRTLLPLHHLQKPGAQCRKAIAGLFRAIQVNCSIIEEGMNAVVACVAEAIVSLLLLLVLLLWLWGRFSSCCYFWCNHNVSAVRGLPYSCCERITRWYTKRLYTLNRHQSKHVIVYGC